ncbi:MAG: hypothetical protein HY855_18160 [Burkholderiales bacterium]|nr:hypothetical protein [Burkholderiales bacterium]
MKRPPARCTPQAPLGEVTLFLRGTMNNWAALEDHAFQYHCDAYYLNVELSGQHEFKIADAAWTPALTVPAQRLRFEGEHTLRLAYRGGRPQVTLGPRTFADPLAKPVTDPVALSLRHDSRALDHKSPFGAVPAGTRVDFALTALPGVNRLTLVIERRRLEGNQERLDYTELARLPMQPQRQGTHERWTTHHRFDEPGVHGYWFEAEIGGRRFVFQNNRDSVYWTREQGSNGLGTVAEAPPQTRRIRRFRHTVHAPDFRVPKWAADAIYYYIFPDRFRNGDPANDPTPGRDRYQNHDIEFHADWNSRPYRPGSGDGSDAVHNNDFYGGDLAGIIDKLDHIRALGANTLYLTPLFQAASNHKYDTADYTRIDPAFGSNADFERLTREAARRGMRVILDTSLNHTGSDSIYFDRYARFKRGGAFEGGRVRPQSPYASWYRFDLSKRAPQLPYTGWVGVADLPELDKSSPDFRRFAFGAPDGVMQQWLDRGAAGWRMDVAPWVPDDFWREWRAAVKAHRPDALTIAETWFDASKFLLGDMFDSTMNYIFRNAVLDYAAGGDARRLVPQLELLREAYPPQAFHALMNLLSTHDQPRALHHLGHRGAGSDAATVALAQRRLKLALLFQMAYPGAPAVYYGDEVGVTGGEDPDNRAPFPWADTGGQPDTALQAQVQQLVTLRRDHAVLRRGTLGAPLHVDAHVIAFTRQLGDQWALVATNNADTAQTVSLTLPPGAPGRYADALGAGAVDAPVQAEGGRLTLVLPPLFGRVLFGR